MLIRSKIVSQPYLWISFSCLTGCSDSWLCSLSTPTSLIWLSGIICFSDTTAFFIFFVWVYWLFISFFSTWTLRFLLINWVFPMDFNYSELFWILRFLGDVDGEETEYYLHVCVPSILYWWYSLHLLLNVDSYKSVDFDLHNAGLLFRLAFLLDIFLGESNIFLDIDLMNFMLLVSFIIDGDASSLQYTSLKL